ncbi:DNA-binding NarL/FixJ family response regulator [Croceifilum oryzae]|uniref:DNA-binding NarL/FixJ family response regulator n=1 Tax=Croceifilum oryzae TaxID=1553429 RepID=A0AAJ1TNE5_9BACL|nr:response regulator transcription factor [Croceifilum oryzae]MDQ0417975.1 DNA-binding NarL/FixJ family response regulator [Croceifilum oryzae]
MKVFLIESQTVLREALTRVLKLESNITVVGSCEGGKSVLSQIERLQPDIVVLDIDLPISPGLELAKDIIDRQLGCKIVFLTSVNSGGVYLREAMKLGVHGYLLKDISIGKLVGSLYDIQAGSLIFSSSLEMDQSVADPLRKREKDVLLLLMDGLETKEIAEQLFLSEWTVRNYIYMIMRKLNVKTRVEAVNVARKMGVFFGSMSS